jgi:hypothetical protein
VHFGLDTFRGVVRASNTTHAWKFFCCNGKCPGSTSEDSVGFGPGEDEHHLYNVLGGTDADRFESPAADHRRQYPELVAELAALLPPPHMTAPNNNSSIPNQGYGCVHPPAAFFLSIFYFG